MYSRWGFWISGLILLSFPHTKSEVRFRLTTWKYEYCQRITLVCFEYILLAVQIVDEEKKVIFIRAINQKWLNIYCLLSNADCIDPFKKLGKTYVIHGSPISWSWNTEQVTCYHMLTFRYHLPSALEVRSVSFCVSFMHALPSPCRFMQTRFKSRGRKKLRFIGWFSHMFQ